MGHSLILVGFALGQFNLLGPDGVVEELAQQIQRQCESDDGDKEEDALGQLQDLQHRVYPHAGIVLHHMDPHQVGAHKGGQSGQALTTLRIRTVRGEQFQDDEDHNVCVQDMVQPAVEI